MKNLFKRIIFGLTLIVLVVVIRSEYIQRDSVGVFLTEKTRPIAHLLNIGPCDNPVTYHIGSFDTKFGLNKEQFLQAIEQAILLWEKPAGKKLFVYDDNSNLTINLVYDYRQKATEELAALGITIQNSKASYEELKRQYEIFQAEYKKEKLSYDTAVNIFESRKNAYEKEIAHWNSVGGAPKERYDILIQERKYLDDQIILLNEKQKILNQKINDVNIIVNRLNRLARQFNITVEKLNTIGATTEKEFNEGEYEQDGNNKSITIYQFDSGQKLFRVLAHELGHALGLDHVDDPHAIMYYLNESGNEKPTNSDIEELQKVCGF